MPWILTTACDTNPVDSESYCICDDITLDPFLAGTEGDTQVFDCLPCGNFGLQPDPYYCCNLSGSVSE